MEQSVHNTERHKDVFEFRDEENRDNSDHWSKICAIISNPNSDNDCISHAHNLKRNLSGRGTPVKEVLSVTTDDDVHHCTNDNSAGPLDSPRKASCEESEIPDRSLKQLSGSTDRNIEHNVPSPCTQERVSTTLGLLPENGHGCPMIPESPCCNVDFGDDMIHESSPSSPDSELEVKNVPSVGQIQCQSVGGLETDAKDTVIIQTDYVTYCEKYFPAPLILFSSDSFKMKASFLEEDSAACSYEWNLDDILKIETQWRSLADVAKVRMLLTNNATHSENGDRTSGVEVVEFLVPDWSEYQELITSLNVRYNALLSIGFNTQSCNGDLVSLEDSECFSDPYIPNFEEPFEEVVYQEGELDAVSVRKSDVDLLLPDVFINDTIIDFYITYLKHGIPDERRHHYHFFSSFFFRKLADLDKNPSSMLDGKAAFQRVRRWTRKVNIFDKDYIFIPVNYNLHWSLIILCHPGEVANLNDENIGEALKVPCILHFDSIRGSHAGLKDLLQSYLLEEWKEKQKETPRDVSSKFLNLRFLSLEVPQQENYTDCGLFLLHYAELFINEAPQNFSPFGINKFDHFLKPDWFTPAEASLKRVHIQRLIYELLKSLSNECASPLRSNVSHSFALPVNKENDNCVQIVSGKTRLERSWNGSSLYSDQIQGMELSMLDKPIYRPSHCVDRSRLGMTELLEQQCQHYNRGSSIGQLRYSIPITREVETDNNIASSNLGLLPIDQDGEFHIDCSSEDSYQAIECNSDLSDQGDTEDTSSSDVSHSGDDTSEETMILEFTRGRHPQSADLCRNEMDQSKKCVNSQDLCWNENMDQSEERVDSQYSCWNENVGPSKENVDYQESCQNESMDQSKENVDIQDSCQNENMDQSKENNDSQDSWRNENMNQSKENACSQDSCWNEIMDQYKENKDCQDLCPNDNIDQSKENVDNQDSCRNKNMDQSKESKDNQVSCRNVNMDQFKENIVSQDSCQNEKMCQFKEDVDSQEHYASASSDIMVTPAEDSQELTKKYGSHDLDNPLPSYIGVVDPSQEDLFLSNSEDNNIEDDEVGGFDEEVSVVEDCPPDQLRPAKRLRLSPSPQ